MNWTAPIINQLNRGGDVLMYADQARRRDEMVAEEKQTNALQRTMLGMQIEAAKRSQTQNTQHQNALMSAASVADFSKDPEGFLRVYVQRGGSIENAIKMADEIRKGEFNLAPGAKRYSRAGSVVADNPKDPSEDYVIKDTDAGLQYFPKKPGGAPIPTGVQGKPNPLDKLPDAIAGKGMTELSKAMSDSLVKEHEKTQGAVSGLQNIQEAKQLLDKGVITGTGADWITQAGNFLASRLGFTSAEDPVANTQAYQAMMGRQVGEIIKQFGSGTGLSDADREYAMKIAGGNISVSETALRKIIDINERAYKNTIRNYNQRANQAMNRPGAGSLPFDLRIDMKALERPPAAPASGATKTDTGKKVVKTGTDPQTGRKVNQYEDGSIGYAD